MAVLLHYNHGDTYSLSQLQESTEIKMVRILCHLIMILFVRLHQLLFHMERCLLLLCIALCPRATPDINKNIIKRQNSIVFWPY